MLSRRPWFKHSRKPVWQPDLFCSHIIVITTEIYRMLTVLSPSHHNVYPHPPLPPVAPHTRQTRLSGPRPSWCFLTYFLLDSPPLRYLQLPFKQHRAGCFPTQTHHHPRPVPAFLSNPDLRPLFLVDFSRCSPVKLSVTTATEEALLQ